MSNNNNGGGLLNILIQVIKLFCGGNDQQQQQQQGQYEQQQQGQYLQQYQPHAYPPQQQPQQAHQQSWAQAAGGGVATQPYQTNHYYQQQEQQQQQQQQDYHNGNYHSQQQGQGYNRPNGLPSGGVIGPHHPAHQDMINATNEQYTNLRNQARQESDLAHKCFAESQQAYQSGNGEKAHNLSVQGKEHQKKQEQLDDQASAWIFNENNKQSPPGTIDLHGLYVKEAIERTESAIASAQRSGDQQLRVIVGKGIHSQGHVAKIKPAVEELMQKYNLSAHVDPENTGVLIVDLTGSGSGRSRDASGIVDDISNGKEDCVIM